MLSPDAHQLLIASLAAACVAGILVALLFSQIFRGAEDRRRFAAIASAGATKNQSTEPDELERKRAVEAKLREFEENQRIRKGARPTLRGRIRQAGLAWSNRTYYLVCIICGAVVVIALIALQFELASAIGFGVATGIAAPHFYVNLTRARRLKRFAAEFPNAVDVIVRGVKSGLPLGDCLRIIASEAQEPVRSEFRTIVEDQTLGVPVDESVKRLAERIPLPEANFFAIVIALQSRTGGSLSEALGNLSKVLRERVKLAAKVKAVSSEAKASAGIIGSLPVIVTALVYLTSPEYIMLLFTTTTGHLVLSASAVWMGAGIFIMRKMINFDF